MLRLITLQAIAGVALLALHAALPIFLVANLSYIVLYYIYILSRIDREQRLLVSSRYSYCIDLT